MTMPGTMDEMVREATVIVRGRVVLLKEQSGKTGVTLRVSRSLKGVAKKRKVKFTVSGGALDAGDERQVVVEGQPVFHLKDEVIVFLCGTENNFSLCRGERSVFFSVDNNLDSLQKEIKEQI